MSVLSEELSSVVVPGQTQLLLLEPVSFRLVFANALPHVLKCMLTALFNLFFLGVLLAFTSPAVLCYVAFCNLLQNLFYLPVARAFSVTNFVQMQTFLEQGQPRAASAQMSYFCVFKTSLCVIITVVLGVLANRFYRLVPWDSAAAGLLACIISAPFTVSQDDDLRLLCAAHCMAKAHSIFIVLRDLLMMALQMAMCVIYGASNKQLPLLVLISVQIVTSAATNLLFLAAMTEKIGNSLGLRVSVDLKLLLPFRRQVVAFAAVNLGVNYWYFVEHDLLLVFVFARQLVRDESPNLKMINLVGMIVCFAACELVKSFGRGMETFVVQFTAFNANVQLFQRILTMFNMALVLFLAQLGVGLCAALFVGYFCQIVYHFLPAALADGAAQLDGRMFGPVVFSAAFEYLHVLSANVCKLIGASNGYLYIGQSVAVLVFDVSLFLFSAFYKRQTDLISLLLCSQIFKLTIGFLSCRWCAYHIRAKAKPLLELQTLGAESRFPQYDDSRSSADQVSSATRPQAAATVSSGRPSNTKKGITHNQTGEFFVAGSSLRNTGTEKSSLDE